MGSTSMREPTRGCDPGGRAFFVLEDGRTFAFEVLHAGNQSAVLRLPGYRGPDGLVGRIVEIGWFGGAAPPDHPEAGQTDRPERRPRES